MTKKINTIEELNAETKEGVTIVDFYADWCGPCKALAPTLETLTENNNDKLKVLKVDVDKNPELAGKYDVKGIPALFFFKNGSITGSVTGNLPLHELQQRVDQLL